MSQLSATTGSMSLISRLDLDDTGFMVDLDHAAESRHRPLTVTRSTQNPTPATPPFVAVSDITVPAGGRAAVVDAFTHRLGAVDSWPGFQGLQVWSDPSDPTALVMVSWWDTQEAFAAYMGSADHRRSHERIPTGADRPRPQRFRRYQVIAR